MNRLEPYQYLPTYAKCAIDWIDCNSDKRNSAELRSALESYAATYGTKPEDYVIDSALHICSRRFADFSD